MGKTNTNKNLFSILFDTVSSDLGSSFLGQGPNLQKCLGKVKKLFNLYGYMAWNAAS
jgi:hypothetical protein